MHLMPNANDELHVIRRIYTCTSLGSAPGARGACSRRRLTLPVLVPASTTRSPLPMSPTCMAWHAVNSWRASDRFVVLARLMAQMRFPHSVAQVVH